MATILARVGWRTTVLDGGYRTYRRHVQARLYDETWPLNLVLLDGDGGELGLTRWLAQLDESEPVKCGPTPADEVAFFQLSGRILTNTQKARLAGQYRRDYERLKRKSA